MRIFVTGGAGYVGSHCVRALCDAGHDVVVLDNLAKGHAPAVDARATLVVGELGHADLLGRLFAQGRFEAVMHFAALAEVGESVRNPLLYYRTNLAGSLTLLEVMREHQVRSLVFSSSCAVYGAPNAVPIPEDAPRQPISPYGRTKLATEWLLEDSATAWGLYATALRYFNAAGAAADGTLGEDHDPESHLIPRVLRVALDQEHEIAIFGQDYSTPDGTCIRDYVHVDDLAAAHRLAIEHRVTDSRGHGPTFRAYNVATGRGHSVRQVIEAARAITGHPIPVTVGPRREGDPPALYADARRVQGELGWSPKYTEIMDIIATAWAWHRARPGGFEAG